MDSFTIRDLENLSGIKAHTLRMWEQRYDFIKPGRTTTRIRFYRNTDLKKILNIALLNKFGVKVSSINRMKEADISEKILSLTQPLAQQERIVNDLIRHMIDIDMASFERSIDDYILARGIEKTILQIIFPFLDRIGILWQTGHINPAQEHLVSNIIRQKLIVGIESVNPPANPATSVLLFLPEGEHHEMGLLFMCYIFKTRGISVIYMGANIPLKDVAYLVNIKSPDYLYTHLTTAGQNFSFEKFLSSAKKHFGTVPMVISGRLTASYEKKLRPPAFFKRSLAEMMEFIDTLPVK